MGSSASKSTTQNKTSSAKDYHARGQKLLSKDKIKAATAAFKKAYKADPSNVENLEDLAHVLRLQDEFPMLIEVGRAIVERKPGDADAVCYLGGDVLASGRVEEAIALFYQVVSLKPDHDQVYEVLGAACWGAERYAEALQAFQTSAKMYPERAMTYNNIGGALTSLERYDEAIEAYEHALTFSRIDLTSCLLVKNFNYFADCHIWSTRDLRDAEMNFHSRGGLKLDPNLIEAERSLGDMLQNQGRNEEAIVVLEKVLEKEPENGVIWKILGHALKGVGRDAEGKEALLKFFRLTIEDPVELANMEKQL